MIGTLWLFKLAMVQMTHLDRWLADLPGSYALDGPLRDDLPITSRGFPCFP